MTFKCGPYQMVSDLVDSFVLFVFFMLLYFVLRLFLFFCRVHMNNCGHAWPSRLL